MRRGILNAFQTMMETLDLTAQQAMDALCIPAGDRPEYSAHLREKSAPHPPELR